MTLITKFMLAMSDLHKKEGEYANNPKDRGGETYKGIARNFWPKWSGWEIIDSAKKQFPEQPAYGTYRYKEWVKELNARLRENYILRQMVREFYYDNFWQKNFDVIDDQKIINWMFTVGVNVGGRRGVKWIQKAVGVIPDGICGPITTRAINNTTKSTAQVLLDARSVAIDYYTRIVQRYPNQIIFLKNWLSRI